MFDLCWNIIPLGTWSPHLKQDIMMLEKVQRRFTKRLRRYRNLSYTDRLIKLAFAY